MYICMYGFALVSQGCVGYLSFFKKNWVESECPNYQFNPHGALKIFKSAKSMTYFTRLCLSALRAWEGRCGFRGILPISEPTLTCGLGRICAYVDRPFCLFVPTVAEFVCLFVCLGFEDPSNHWTKRMANKKPRLKNLVRASTS